MAPSLLPAIPPPPLHPAPPAPAPAPVILRKVFAIKYTGTNVYIPSPGTIISTDYGATWNIITPMVKRPALKPSGEHRTWGDR